MGGKTAPVSLSEACQEASPEHILALQVLEVFKLGRGEENQASPLLGKVGEVGKCNPTALSHQPPSRQGEQLVRGQSSSLGLWSPKGQEPSLPGTPFSSHGHARPQLMAQEHGPFTEEPGSPPSPAPCWLCDLRQVPCPAGSYRRSRWPLRSPLHLLPHVRSINSKQFYKFSWQSLIAKVR